MRGKAGALQGHNLIPQRMHCAIFAGVQEQNLSLGPRQVMQHRDQRCQANAAADQHHRSPAGPVQHEGAARTLGLQHVANRRLIMQKI